MDGVEDLRCRHAIRTNRGWRTPRPQGPMQSKPNRRESGTRRAARWGRFWAGWGRAGGDQSQRGVSAGMIQVGPRVARSCPRPGHAAVGHCSPIGGQPCPSASRAPVCTPPSTDLRPVCARSAIIAHPFRPRLRPFCAPHPSRFDASLPATGALRSKNSSAERAREPNRTAAPRSDTQARWIKAQEARHARPDGSE